MRNSEIQFAVVGAGPYGLAVANHLRTRGREVCVFGKAMDFWHRQMPEGLLLRSPWGGSHIGDWNHQLTLDRYEETLGRPLNRRLTLEDFVSYGQWFQQQCVADLDTRTVIGIDSAPGGYRIMLEDSCSVRASRVVVAAGIAPFANYPDVFAGLPSELVSHASDPGNKDLRKFSGKNVAVIGGGQSATEFAALLLERGSNAEMFLRQPHLRWLEPSRLRSVPTVHWLFESTLNPFRAPGKIGPVGLSWLIEHPELFTKIPRKQRDALAYWAIGPAASHWLKPRTSRLKINGGCRVTSATRHGDGIHLKFDQTGELRFDHVLLCTGYKVDLARYAFISANFLKQIKTVGGYPVLNSSFESVSCPGLYFLGATAAYSRGPYFRFVAGTGYAAAAVSRHSVAA